MTSCFVKRANEKHPECPGSCQLGAVVDSISSSASTFVTGEFSTVSTPFYIVSSYEIALDSLALTHPRNFLIVIFVSVASAFLALSPHLVVLDDGTIVKLASMPKVVTIDAGLSR
ncbi:uncharacterized protein PHACADRAFT_193957 [Phanerochaete carnosa HHB-10118-sp]|uniref:Uncharacterized protein n=1 Tax=Phanerochaete carnosa (strain HHB-10118-sp) TaxID=650164 RepID=K5X0S2_PHACS|nr:uncharacterized protein PHACADRAFT_193957 [Phanerochaete carnosa HHB-10118-sp]EKM56342.1 hypothetical protein PHACADRAFT_193957 [Phanerochaete carnosa HHB-10118-sp]